MAARENRTAATGAPETGGAASAPPATERNGIGQLNESSLHATIKTWCARPGDRLEVPVDGYVIDIERDGLLIEIQTRNFSALRAKLAALLADHAVRLVYPLVAEKWIVHVDADNPELVLRRRKSPRRGGIGDLFDELAAIPELIDHPRFSVQVLWTQVEEVRCADGRGSWRRRGVSVLDQRLLAVVNEASFACREDLARLLPAELPDPFTNRDLAASMDIPMRGAQRMTYCLRRTGALCAEGRRGRLILYRRQSGPDRPIRGACGADQGENTTEGGGLARIRGEKP